MAPLDFEILSKLMRYVFTFLGVVIVWRSFVWLHKDRKATHKRLKALPDAGTIGQLTVLAGSTELREGAILGVPPEGVLGFVRTCDIVVPVTDVVAQHLDFTFRNGKGLYIYPRRGCPTYVDGVLIDSRAASRRHPMRHGSVLQAGEALLQLGVFVGLDVQHADGMHNNVPPADEAPHAPLPPPVSPPQYMPPDAGIPGGQPSPWQSYPTQGGVPAYQQFPPQGTPPAQPIPPQPYYPGYSPAPVTPPERRPGDGT